MCIIIQEGFLDRSAIVYVSTMDGTAINSSIVLLNCVFYVNNDCSLFTEIANYSPLRYSEVQFLNGDGKNTTRCINITVFDDMIVEDAKDFRVSLTTNDSGVRAVSPSTTTVIILDTNCTYIIIHVQCSQQAQKSKSVVILYITFQSCWCPLLQIHITAVKEKAMQQCVPKLSWELLDDHFGCMHQQ